MATHTILFLVVWAFYWYMVARHFIALETRQRIYRHFTSSLLIKNPTVKGLNTIGARANHMISTQIDWVKICIEIIPEEIEEESLGTAFPDPGLVCIPKAYYFLRSVMVIDCHKQLSLDALVAQLSNLTHPNLSIQYA